MNTNQHRIDFRAGVLRGLAHPLLDCSFTHWDSQPGDEIASVEISLTNRKMIPVHDLNHLLAGPEEYGTHIGVRMRIEILRELKKFVAELEAIDEN